MLFRSVLNCSLFLLQSLARLLLSLGSRRWSHRHAANLAREAVERLSELLVLNRELLDDRSIRVGEQEALVGVARRAVLGNYAVEDVVASDLGRAQGWVRRRAMTESVWIEVL